MDCARDRIRHSNGANLAPSFLLNNHALTCDRYLPILLASYSWGELKAELPRIERSFAIGSLDQSGSLFQHLSKVLAMGSIHRLYFSTLCFEAWISLILFCSILSISPRIIVVWCSWARAPTLLALDNFALSHSEVSHVSEHLFWTETRGRANHSQILVLHQRGYRFCVRCTEPLLVFSHFIVHLVLDESRVAWSSDDRAVFAVACGRVLSSWFLLE